MTVDGQHIGQRIREYRLLAGLSQQDLADRLGVSAAYVSMIEKGWRALNGRSLTDAIAQALGVDTANLIRPPAHAPSPSERQLRMSVPAVRSALDWSFTCEPIPHQALAADVQAVVVARMTCDYRRLGASLAPTLGRALRWAETGDHAGLRALTQVAVTASLALRPIGYIDLAVRLAERGRTAAEHAEWTAGTAAADFAIAQCALAGGTDGLRRRSLQLAATAVDNLSNSPAEVGWAVMMNLQAGLASAALGRTDDALARVASASELAGQVGVDEWRIEPTRANAGVWRVGILLEAGEHGWAVSAAREVDRSALRTTQRTAHLLTHVGRAYCLSGRPEEATRALLEADRLAPSEVRWRSSVRESVGLMLREARRNAGSEHLRDLAVKMNVDPLAVK
ncbi:hypothetical protein GCM10010124_29050 [Pilimelia terevasa]|uniref:HTH cro/C1-type domain-containing protein n=1 Tax=Pilimelia terevasa TaxID=53372 RepID=A0A8J3FJ12_9ACTN|nr:helix-turn-helix domain-containing protein [Pilimelia terevasa]GGK34573.1 hypothetical protein GCM10010124_29050 [Pilimelia terevasa]